jgi:nucleotide-binding universal stress UspA family protein
MNTKKLLVATDLSDASYRALQCAIMVAKKFNSEIILLHIFEVADVDENAKRMLASNFLNRDIKRQLQETVKETAANEGIKITYLTKDGELFTSMNEAANETSADIMFVGTHGVKGVQHLTGSFIAATVNTTSLPVWIIQKETALKPYENIVVYIDEYPEEPLNVITLGLARAFNSNLTFVFTEPSNAFKVTEMVQNLKTTLEGSGLEHTCIFISDSLDKHKSLLDIAVEKTSPLIVLDRNHHDIDMQVHILTNKHHMEVLCLNS